MKIKVADVIDAMEENGYPWTQHVFVKRNSKKQFIGACIIGQAALNLGVGFEPLYHALNEILPGYQHLGGEIAAYNDSVAGSYEGVLKFAKRKLEPIKNREIVLTKVTRKNLPQKEEKAAIRVAK